MSGARAYDAIVIGAGVNSLAAAATLAKAGRAVLVLERRATVGGAGSALEIEPGFHADAAYDDIGWIPSSLVRDLDLTRHVRIVSSAMPVVAADGNDASLTFTASGPDLDGLRRLSPRDASRWPEFAGRVAAIAGFLRTLYAAPVPDTALDQAGDLRTALRLALKYRGLGRRDMVEVLRVLPMSIAEWLDDWFEHPLLKGALAARGVTHSAFGPRAAGTAFVFLHHQVAARPGAMRSGLRVEGGIGVFASGLARAAQAAGAEVRTGAEVRRITAARGAVDGVELASGERIAAARVVSGASPRHTFLELCEPARLEPGLVNAVSRIRYRGAFARVHFSLDGLPSLGGDRASGALVAPDMDYLERAADDAKYGRASERPFVHAFVPTVADPSRAPEGKHVLSAHVQYAPYRLRAGRWDDAARDALADRVLDALERHVPGLRALVRRRAVLTPAELERDYGLPEGHAYHGELALDQAMFMRPVPACSHYRSPVRGLYVCGPGAHPGGGTAGVAGANAARAVLADGAP